MDKILRYVPVVLLLSFAFKSLKNTLTWESVTVTLVFATLWYLLDTKQESKKVKEIEQKLLKLEKDFEEQEKLVADLRSSVSSLRVSNGLKPQNFKNFG